MAKRIEVYFATNRKEAGKAAPWYGNTFHAGGSELYRVGKAWVEPPRGGETADEGEYALKKVETFPEKAGTGGADSAAGTLLGSTRLFTELKARMREESRDLLVLIHGYASSFATAAERAAELCDKYAYTDKTGETRHPLVLAFSWPANGETIPFSSYISDRQDAAKSGVAIARLFFRLCDFFLAEAQAARAARDDATERERRSACPSRIHLLAHSMGNWALRNAVQAVIERRGTDRLPAIFDNIFLMAADEDEDTLQDRLKLALLPRLGNAVHVYHSKDDRALVISDTTKLNPDRLGHNGPLDMLATDEKVVAVDCRHVDTTGFLHANHQYYRLQPLVIADVRAVLAGRRAEEVPNRKPLTQLRRYLIEPPAGEGDREPFAGRERHDR
jgi:esterase/lipase superfamily enzyme